MGFVKEIYSNNRAGLVVVFGRGKTSENYFDGDSVEKAMEHFNLYLKNNELYVKTEDEQALNDLKIDAKDAVEFRNSINSIINVLTDEQAIMTPILFPLWNENTYYETGERVRYSNNLYKVLQAHDSQATWLPDVTPSLYAPMLINEETGEILNWVQPDSTNGYSKDDKVFHNGKVWISLIDNNVFEPGVDETLWTESVEEWNSKFVYSKEAKVIYQNITYISLSDDNNSIPNTETSLWVEEGVEIISEWTSGKSYQIGNKVVFEDSTYESLIDNNVWSPKEYPAGWQEVSE